MKNRYSRNKQKILKYASISLLTFGLFVSLYNSVKIIINLKGTYQKLEDLLSIFPHKNYKILYEDLKNIKDELNNLSKDGLVNIMTPPSVDFYSIAYPLIPLEMAKFDPKDKPMSGVYLSYNDIESIQTLTNLSMKLVKKSNYFIIWTY